MNEQIFQEVDHYIQTRFAAEDEHLEAVVPSLEGSFMQHGNISPNQGKFLQVAAKMCNAQRILEIGTLGGYSTIWLARALPHNGELISLERDPGHAEVARKNIANAGLQDKVQVIVGPALDSLHHLETSGALPFDLIFIDADQPPYADYLRRAIRLSRPGTVIIADNVIRKGEILNPDTTDEVVKGVQRFNELLATSPELTATILPTFGIKSYDGMAIAVVNI